MYKKICPSIEDCKIKNFVECKEKSCNKVFKSESNLNLHLAKTHGKVELLKIHEFKQYHCPDPQCIYHNRKYLKSMKLLRQHYSKVHSTKDFNCNHCLDRFTSQKSFENHLPYCGVKFSCCDCDAQYPSYETLQTHGRRKRHNILSKKDYTLKIVATNKFCPVRKLDKFILPKPISIIVISNCNTKSLQNKEQTTEASSQQPQLIVKPTFQTIATQTEENCKFIKESKNLKNQKTSSTQTDCIEKYASKHAGKIMSSSTQTSHFNFNVNQDKISSINTNTPLIVNDTAINNGINNFEFDNCHMETQTDFIFEDVMFSSDYLMSNMYTQTCDDYLNQFSFNDIQTQTVFDDEILKSVESPKTHSNYSCKDMSHTETQTDAEFRQMLEEINS